METTVAPGDSGAPAIPATAPVPAPAPADTSPITARQAGQALAARRAELAKQRQETPADPAPQEAAVEQPPEPAKADNADAPQEPPGETPQQPEPAEELPPIEPPRSWTKEAKDEFRTYPREAQERIAQREQERDRATRQSQNEAAEQRKAIEAERDKVEQARLQYEAALPALLQTLHDQQAGEFADIKSQADVDRLVKEDPFRYLQWDAHSKRVAAVQGEIAKAEQRRNQEYQSRWAEFAEREDKLAVDKMPELADPDKRAKVQQGALSYLKDAGFKDSDLGALWNGQASLSLRDHRVQAMIRDAVLYRESKANAAKVTAKPLPPVVKPGVAAARNAAQDQNIMTLSQRLDQTGNMRDAAKLLAAKRAARSR